MSVSKEYLIVNSASQRKVHICSFKFLLLLFISIVVIIVNGFFLLKIYSRLYLVGETEKKPCTQPAFDEYLLTVRWPPSFCMNRECQNNKEQWIIHGLWPNYKNNDSYYPQFCCNSWHFNLSQLNPIVPQLESLWPNLIEHKQYYSLWKHEWSKHGTCAVKQAKTEFGYFNITLMLFEEFSVENYLNKAGIHPITANDPPISMDKLKSAMQVVIGKRVHFECINVRKTITSYPLIDSITLCLNTSLNPIDCTQKDSNCEDEIVYPRINFNN